MADKQEKQQGKKAYLYEQDDVGYVPISATNGQACGGCRWFNEIHSDNMAYNPCQLIQCYPMPIRETGWCDKFTAIPEPEPSFNDVIEDLALALGSREHKVTLKERLLSLIGYKEQPKARDEPLPLTGFKSLPNHQWVGWWTNNFEDREGDFFPNHAIDSYIARVDGGVTDYPTLRYWHIPVELGKVKAIARIALDDSPNAPSFVISVGEYADTPLAKAFESGLSTSGKNYKMSHGFYYPEAAYLEGVYHVFDSFEHTVLPDYAAANAFSIFGDMAMPVLDERKRKELVDIVGETLTKEFEQKAEARAQELKAMGVNHKDFPIVDKEAREGISEVKSAVTDLATAMKELVTEMKAAKKPADDEEDKEGKMDKLFGGKKKELDDAIAAAKAATAALEAKQKEFDSLTPRQASKSNETQIDPEDPAFKAFREQMAGSGTTEKQKEFNQLFGAALNMNGNGG